MNFKNTTYELFAIKQLFSNLLEANIDNNIENKILTLDLDIVINLVIIYFK